MTPPNPSPATVAAKTPAWRPYLSLMGRLADCRAAERELHERVQARTTGQRRTLAALGDRIADSEAALAELGTDLRFALPPPTAAAPPTPPDLDGALKQATRHLDEGDTQMRALRRLGELSPLLPYTPAVTRNIVVYAVWALFALVGQLVLLGPATMVGLSFTDVIAWVCCGLPVVATLLGYLTIMVSTTPRWVADRADGRVASAPRSPRLGAAICFGILPLCWLILKAFTLVVT